MKKWGVLLTACILSGCGSSDGIILLTNNANEQVRCGPFSTKAPVRRFLEGEFGAPGAAERVGPTGDEQLADCVDGYVKQGYRLIGYPGQTVAAAVAPPPAPTPAPPPQPDRARPVYDAAVSTAQGGAGVGMADLRTSAAQRDTQAQIALGKAYEDGLGVPQDFVQAHMWYNLAAAGSGTSAAERELRDIAFKGREALAQRMSTDQIAEAQKLAREWQPAQN